MSKGEDEDWIFIFLICYQTYYKNMKRYFFTKTLKWGVFEFCKEWKLFQKSHQNAFETVIDENLYRREGAFELIYDAVNIKFRIEDEWIKSRMTAFI